MSAELRLAATALPEELRPWVLHFAEASEALGWFPCVYRDAEDDLIAEWSTPHRRVGIILSVRPEQCGWYVATRGFFVDDGFGSDFADLDLAHLYKAALASLVTTKQPDCPVRGRVPNVTEAKLFAMLQVLTLNRDTHEMLEARGVTAEDLREAFALALEGLLHRGKNAKPPATPYVRSCDAPSGTHGRAECGNPLPCSIHDRYSIRPERTS